MAPAESKSSTALDEELLRLEAELARVVALSTTSDAQRADLTERLRRLKKKASGAP